MKIWVIHEDASSIPEIPRIEPSPAPSYVCDPQAGRVLLGVSGLGAVMILWWVMTFPVAQEPQRADLLSSKAQVQQSSAVSSNRGMDPSPLAQSTIHDNRPPVIRSLEIIPSRPHLGDAIQAGVVASDPDGDPVYLSYIWFVNGEKIMESYTPDFPDIAVRKHDSISVWAIPWDRYSEGEYVASQPVEIVNRPPQINSSPSTVVQNGVYVYGVEASDLDGDKLLFRLTEAPEDMIIDPESGMIRWSVPDVSKEVEVWVVASDGDGAEAFQQFRLFLRSDS